MCTLEQEYINIKEVAKAKGLTTTRSIRIAISKLTFDNGWTTNEAKITSDANTNNELIVGNANSTTLTLKEGSDLNTGTDVTINSKGTLNTVANYVNGTVTNDGSLCIDGKTGTDLAFNISNSSNDTTKGTTYAKLAQSILRSEKQ